MTETRVHTLKEMWAQRGSKARPRHDKRRKVVGWTTGPTTAVVISVGDAVASMWDRPEGLNEDAWREWVVWFAHFWGGPAAMWGNRDKHPYRRLFDSVNGLH